MSNTSIYRQSFILMACFLLVFGTAWGFGPTITANGYWDSISSFQVIQAKINDKNERVCLPKITFKDDVDLESLKKQVKEGIESQEAVFNLYHDGLGRPEKKGGMYYASDVYLKKLKITYTGYLRKLGYKFTIAKGPAYEDKEVLRSALYDQHISERMAEQKKEEEENAKKPAKAARQKSGMRVTTIYDVLPKGVIPPAIRRQQQEIARRVNALKNRPYDTEIVQVDPLRWAAGRMGLLREDGSISGANVEGQKPELFITPPSEKGWLTTEMIAELNGQLCEFVLQRYTSGLEVFENNRYYLRDIYFSALKLSWEEWLQKHGKTYVEPVLKAGFASGTIALEVKLVTGKWNQLRAPVFCQIDFSTTGPLVEGEELLRVFPPNPRPAKFIAFANQLNKLLKDKEADVSMLVCPDGKPYHELGQKRARRVYFPEFKATLDMMQNDLLTGKIK